MKSLNDARFPYTYKVALCAAKLKTGDGTYYLKPSIDYMKYWVIEMEADQPITGRTISTDRLYTSIKSTNWLLDHDSATVGTLPKGKMKIPSEVFDTLNKEISGATCHLKRRRRTIS